MKVTPEQVIRHLVATNIVPASGKFEVTEDVIYAYFFYYRQLGGGVSAGTNSNVKYARRLAGLNLLKENLSRGVKASEIKAGHIYLISSPAYVDYYKVGVSYDCHTRLAQYQTYSPFRDFRLEKYDFVLDKFLVEKQILSHPLIDRATGEWVKVDNAKLIFDDIAKHNTSEYLGLW